MSNDNIILADQLMHNGNTDRALPIYLEYIKDDPKNDKVLINIFSIYLSTNKKNDALDYLERSYTIQPTMKKIRNYDFSLYRP
ncbi:hypothetical protein BGC07_13670 [Piscirickettsia litoralis]|uniref:Tetratricopeptide repeat protein n=1 Tax=Piscirickettsia litoralis TaxID=1891921 RepID=A0ABX3A4H6_9GAMM|nr:hypothetical protein BGC07_13670 [Piscirickettsia litoralis]